LRDTGAGLNGKSSEDLLKNGMGLKNTGARLRKIYGEQEGLEWESTGEPGFGLRFTIPI
jgi:sensor histidine kinase YesM